jgi:hypothetical protein
MEPREIRIRVPHLGGQLTSNLVGAAGLVCLVVAVAGLAGGWWALLLAGLVLVVVAVVAQASTPVQTPAAAPATGQAQGERRPRAVG